MWGAVIGDIAGSIYEYKQYKKTSHINVEKIIDENGFFSDDTILTVAIYDAILNNGDYGKYLKEYGLRYLNYKPDTIISEHFETTFGGNFARWLKGERFGNSTGNGAMMRISGIGKMFDTESDVINNVILATMPSHNTQEAIECAQTVALIIYYARMGYDKQQIMKAIGINHVEYKPFEKFNKTCYETIDNCLYALFSANNFEEAIKTVISFGGDTDTNAAIVGGMAEALFGVPEYLVTAARKKLPVFLSFVIDQAYIKKIRRI